MHACGGGPDAPCGCVHGIAGEESERRYDCENCPVICRERRVPKPDGTGTWTYRDEVQAGLPLDRLRLVQRDLGPLPPFIPTRTHEMNVKVRPPFPWVGVDLKTLLSVRDDGSATPRKLTRNGPTEFRQALRVDPSTKVVAVLNGRDNLLEGLWGMDPETFSGILRDLGIDLVTGPTFSVYGDRPAAHNVVMMLRHHRSADDLAAGGLTVAPNLYWRTAADRRRWVSWLTREEDVSVVSRDFSRTGNRASFEPQFRGLLEIAKQVERPLHVLLVGVGVAKGPQALDRLARAGATGSFVTAKPVMAGTGGRLQALRTGRPPREERAPANVSRDEACLHNLQITDVYTRNFDG